MFKITLICPVYNASLYLNDLLESLNNQSFKEFVAIFIDDGSTDDSVNIIENYNSNFSYKVIKQCNKGAPAARNNGLKYVDTPYVYFFDADDVLLPNTLSILYDLIQKSNGDIVLANMSLLSDASNKFIKKYEKNLFYAMNWIPTPGVHLFKTDIIKKNGLRFSDLRIGQDINFCLKYLSFCEKIIFTDEIVYLYRDDSPGISRTYSKKIFDIVPSLEEAEKYYDDIFPFFDLKIKHYYVQFSKFEFFNTFSERCEVYYYFLEKILQLKISSNNQRKKKCLTISKMLFKFYRLLF